ncbi:MAG: hypothetical protein IT458_13915 [Planctomycetes bacterium]|nr:hypothetical protein [Planctomycetota bacterium]
MRSILILLPLVLGAPLAAQVPHGHLITAESTNGNSEGLFVVWPAESTSTPIRTPTGAVQLGTCTTVAIDPADPDALWTVGGVSIGGAPVVRVDLNGNLMVGRGGGALTIFGQVWRLHVAGPDMLLTIVSGANAGLWRMPLGQRTPVRLLTLNDAADIAVLGTKAYVVAGNGGSPSTIAEVDLVTLATRTLGANYPPARALGRFGPGALLLGTESGDLLLVDPVTGGSNLMVPVGAGPITAVGGGVGTLPVYVATSANQILEVQGGNARRVYQTSNTLRDFEVSELDTAAHFAYGSGCAGTNGRVPRVEPAALPALGNGNFILRVTQALPGAAASLVLGASRVTFGSVQLPLDLAPIGMGGCMLHSDVRLAFPVPIDAQGTGVLPVPIPANAALKGQYFTGQYFIVDPAANALGVSASDGAQCWMR